MSTTATTVRKINGYSDISERVLAQASIIRAIANTEVEGVVGFETAKVWVNELSTIADYVPGTGVSITVDGSNYVDINTKKEKGINEILDGYSVMNAPADIIASRLDAAIRRMGETMDTDSFVTLVADGTAAEGTFGATAVTAGNFVIGTRYKVTQANSGGDATDIGCAAETAVVDETFVALTDGTGITALEAVPVIKPTTATIYADILTLKASLDTAKAPKTNRKLVLTPEMENLLLHVDSKVVLNTDRGDTIQTEGYVGRLLGFDIFSTTLLPTGTNMVAMHQRAFAFKEGWKVDARLQSLDGSGTFIGDSAVQGRMAYVYGAVRPTLIQINNGA